MKNNYRNASSIAYCSCLGGLEIKAILHGIDTEIICMSGAWGSAANKQMHRVKVNYTASGRAFIRINKSRVYLDECIRTGV